MSETYHDETETPAAESAESKKAKASKREYLDANGNVTESEADARGVRYTSVAEGWTRDVMLTDLTDDMLYANAAWGLLTRIGNFTNSVRNAKGARSATAPATEAEAVDRMLDNLKANLWTSPSGEGVGGSGLLAEAIVRAKREQEGKDVDPAAIKEWLATLTKEARAELKKRPAIAKAFAEITAERAAARAAAINADDAGGLGDIPDVA